MDNLWRLRELKLLFANALHIFLIQVHCTEAPEWSEKHQQEVQQLQQHHSLGGGQACRVGNPARDHRVGHGHWMSGQEADSSLPGFFFSALISNLTTSYSQEDRRDQVPGNRNGECGADKLHRPEHQGVEPGLHLREGAPHRQARVDH